ncbi:MAG: tRNA (guanine-N(1)-)-methyltransferase [Alphaproteobacteria bacterium ADurb.Bin438]|nr:MAG: tRNA (guanine-N(1)-)-methyltransferase [Alphaproteobacteria bacterium ADurb.Bin438]
MLDITILTLFPEMFPGHLGLSLAGKGLSKEVWKYRAVNIRDYALDKHKKVDDTPYGGGAGMLMKPDVVDRAIINNHKSDALLINLSPRGKLLNQDLVKEIYNASNITLLCGHYEGIDQRVLDKHNCLDVSVGDYILSGGEIAALTLMDALVRLVPEVMGGGEETLKEESFNDGLLEYPQYTKPYDFEGMKVPEILLSGHHENIKKWRYEKSQEITKERRPDLWEKYKIN